MAPDIPRNDPERSVAEGASAPRPRPLLRGDGPSRSRVANGDAGNVLAPSREIRRQAALRRQARRRRMRQRGARGGGADRRSAPAAPEAGIPVAALTGYLGAGGERLLLRNADFAASLRDGRDVDVLVVSARRSERELVRTLGVPLWFARHGHVWSYQYEWGKVDLVSSLEVRGLRYLSVADVFAHSRQAASGVRTPCLAHDAAIAWLTGLLWQGALKKRHRERILAAAENEPETLMRTLTHALGEHWGRHLWRLAACGRPEAADRAAGTLRRAVAVRALANRPLASLRGWARYWLAEARLRLLPPLPWVALLGPDGSGKSSAARALEAALPGCLRDIDHARWRPNLLFPSPATVHPAEDPQGRQPYSPLLSVAKLGFLTLDWWTGHLLRFADARARGRLVVFDRCLLDVLVDPRRHRYRGPRWAARLAIGLAPQPDMVVALSADADTLQRRKREVPPEESARQAAAYVALARRLRAGYVVDATQPADAVATDLAALILAHARTHSARRLGLTPHAAPAAPTRA